MKSEGQLLRLVCLVRILDRGQPARGFVGGDPTIAQLFEHPSSLRTRLRFDSTRARTGLIARGEPQCPQEIVQSRNHRPVRQADLRLDILDDAAVLQKDIEKCQLLGG